MLAVLAFATTAQAATITVNTTGDPGPTGTTSLRQAVAAANPGDTVSVPAGHYTLALGQITVPQPITIAGAGAGSTIIDGNNASRIFDVTELPGTATIEGLTLTRGKVNVTTSNQGGGAVFNQGNTVALPSDTFTDNSVTGGGASGQGGGAVFNGANTVTISGSSFQGNNVTLGGTGSTTGLGGGAVLDHGAGITISGSSFTGNGATLTGVTSDDGGGAYHEAGGGLTATNTSFSNNKLTIYGGTITDGGGGIYDDGGGVTLTAGTLTGNSATLTSVTGFSGGGAYYENGVGLKANSSAFTNNTLTESTTAGTSGGGGLYNDAGGITLTDASVTGNSASLSGSATDVGGGGAFDDASGPSWVNVTLSNNTLGAPAGSSAGGGGLFLGGGTGKLTNTTINGNHSNQNAGAILNTATGWSLKSTIIAGNTSSDSRECDTTGGPGSSLGNNLEDSPTTTCTLSASGDVVNTNPKLAPLTNNGGAGPTNALMAGSPAIDHIPVAQCTDQQPSPQPVPTDERGVQRGLDGFCDVGAFESAPGVNAVSASAAPSSIVVSRRTTVTYKVSDSGPAPSTSTTLRLTVPSGLQLVGATPSQGSCSGSTCALGTIGSGSSARIAVVLMGRRTGRWSLAANVGANEQDPTPADNSVSSSIKVAPPKLSKLKVKHKRVRFRLNVAATVKLTLERCKGRGKHAKCRKVKTFTVHGKGGANKFKLKGKKLRAGRYKLIAVPRVLGVKGKKVTVKFRLK